MLKCRRFLYKSYCSMFICLFNEPLYPKCKFKLQFQLFLTTKICMLMTPFRIGSSDFLYKQCGVNNKRKFTFTRDN